MGYRTRLSAFKALRIGVLVGVLLLISGCNTSVVLNDLSQSEALEVIAALNATGISAYSAEDSGARGKFSVTVDSARYSEAVAIINDKRLPRRSEFRKMIEPKGLLPNSRELEALRVDKARAIELKELLENHPDIASAEVTVRQKFLAEDEAPSVGAMVVTRSGSTLSTDQLRTMIQSFVPGINPERVVVVAHALDSSGNVFKAEGILNENQKLIHVPLAGFLLGWRVAEADQNGLAITIVAFVLAVGILGAILGYSYGSFKRSEDALNDALPEPAIRAGRFERPVKTLPEE